MRFRQVGLLLSVMLAGCATAPNAPRPRPLVAVETTAVGARAGADEVIELGGSNSQKDEVPTEESIPGTGEFTQPIGKGQAAPKVAKVEGEASFNFESASIPEVVKAILGEFLQQNYVIAPGVAGQVTFSTTQPVAGEQAMSILELLLAMNNYAMVWRDGKYLIVPAAEAPRAIVPRVNTESFESGFQVRAVPLKFIAAAEVEKLLQPFARAGAVIRADNARSLVMLAGTPGDLRNYIDTIRTFDVDWMAGMSFGMYTLERVEVKDLMPELEAIFADQNSPLAGMIKLMPIERLNAVLVITPQQRYLKQVESWVRRLDKGGSDAGVRLYVYDVTNVKATDLADRLNEIFTGQSPPDRSSSASGQVAPGLNATEITSSSGRPVVSKNQPVPPVQNMSQPAASSGEGLNLMEGADVRITAVEENNSLLIRSTASQYDVIRSAIRRLDVEPLQVHIEAKILDVQLTKKLNYGVQWYIENGISAANAAQFLGGVPTPTTPTAPTELINSLGNLPRNTINSFGGTLGSTGLRYILDTRSARALVNLLESEGDVKVLSAPSLVVLNNKEASINVGVQIPVNSSSINTGTGSGQVASFVQFRDTGTTLTVTPRVNPGGMVYMEITQEVSSPGASDDAINGNVSVNQKTIQTEIAVQSGKTVLLGGLIQQSDNTSRSGVPGLSRLPLIGGLFGAKSRARDRSELLVLITPTVVRGGSGEMEALTDEYKSRFEGLDALIKEDARAADAARERFETSRGEKQ